MKLEGKTCLILYNRWGSSGSTSSTSNDTSFDSLAEDRSVQTLHVVPLVRLGLIVVLVRTRGSGFAHGVSASFNGVV